jgi:broad specificity phosphatase PhoE
VAAETTTDRAGGAGQVLLLRHGETAWSRDGRHTGRSDVPLTAVGEQQAGMLAPVVARYHVVEVLVSPRQRARATARLAGLADATVDDDLAEWDYGAYEGISTAEIRHDRPGWYLWRDGVPDGETVQQVGERADRVLARIRPALRRGDVALVGHGHALRILAARWIGLPAAAGAGLRLDTGTVNVLGHEHDRPVLRHWNAPLSWAAEGP